ncbi:MAG: XRE family transcriptional regulator [Devosia sp.]
MPIAANDNAPRSAKLPFGVAPRGMNRTEGAAYMGVSPALFDEMVRDGRAPKPKLVNSRTIWDRIALDEAFDALPTKGSVNPWDSVYGQV